MGAPALTDLASVRQHMQKTAVDTVMDEQLEALILEVNEAIPRYCDREFGPTAGATRSFEYLPNDCQWHGPGGSGGDVLDVNPYELRAITKIVMDPEVSGGKELTADQWRLWPYPARDGTFLGIRLGASIQPRPSTTANFPTRRVDITGDWGTFEVPKLIKHYANMAVESAYHLKRDQGAGENVLDEHEAPMRPDDLPPGVKLGLKRAFMRPVFPR